MSFENFYTLFDLSPFAVHVHSATTHTTTLHPLYVCHIISQIAYNDIIENRKIGRDKILNSKRLRLLIISSNALQSHNLKAYIQTQQIKKNLHTKLTYHTLLRTSVTSETFLLTSKKILSKDICVSMQGYRD